MKFLEITPEIEQALVAIMDAGLKAMGYSLIAQIDKIRNSIQMKESKE